MVLTKKQKNEKKRDCENIQVATEGVYSSVIYR